MHKIKQIFTDNPTDSITFELGSKEEAQKFSLRANGYHPGIIYVYEPHIDFSGDDFIVSSNELDNELLEALLNCGGSGPADDAVQYVLDNFNIVGNIEDCADYLRAYGAWEDDELEDHQENLNRLVWLTGCDLEEQGIAHFSTYG